MHLALDQADHSVIFGVCTRDSEESLAAELPFLLALHVSSQANARLACFRFVLGVARARRLRIRQSVEQRVEHGRALLLCLFSARLL